MNISSSKRLISIDRYRGFIVFCMCFFISAAEFPSLGILSRFANNSATSRLMIFPNFSLADLINPTFIFLISLSYQLSFDKRFKKDKKRTYIHFITRYLIFMGLGSIMVSGEELFMRTSYNTNLIFNILMFLSVLLGLSLLVCKKILKIDDDVYKILSKALYVSLIVMGLLVIIYGVRDDFIIFTNGRGYIYKHWSILAEIGCTGLLAIPFLHMNNKNKIISWFMLVILYSLFMCIPSVIDKLDVVVLGGLLGGLGWLIVMLGGIIVMNIYNDNNFLKYIITCCILGFISFILFKLVPLNTSAVTPNYVVFSLLVSTLLFGILNLFNNKNLKYEYFVWWGRNPLPLFAIFLIFRLFQKIWSPAYNTSFIIAFLYTFGTIGILSFIAYKLYKKNKIIKL